MPTPEQLARFYEDATPSSTQSTPASPRPSTPARTTSTPPAGRAQLSPAERRGRMYDDMKQLDRPADADAAQDAAQRRRSEAFEAQRNARRAKFYGPDDAMPAEKPAEKPAN